jgi:hypothetical protein
MDLTAGITEGQFAPPDSGQTGPYALRLVTRKEGMNLSMNLIKQQTSERETQRVILRLTPNVDRRLRVHTNYRGKVSEVVLEILNSVDLLSISLLDKIAGCVPATSVDMPKTLHRKLHRAATTRGISVNHLVNSAIECKLTASPRTKKT